MIKPTVGRVVHLFVQSGAEVIGPMSAMVAFVHSDRMVNLAAFDHNGCSYPRTSVRLLQDDDKPEGEAFWCQWMDYQKGQAAKAEALEAQLAVPHPGADAADAAKAKAGL